MQLLMPERIRSSELPLALAIFFKTCLTSVMHFKDSEKQINKTVSQPRTILSYVAVYLQIFL